MLTLHACIHKLAMPCISGVSSSGAFGISFIAGKKVHSFELPFKLEWFQSFLEERGEHKHARVEWLWTETEHMFAALKHQNGICSAGRRSEIMEMCLTLDHSLLKKTSNEQRLTQEL